MDEPTLLPLRKAQDKEKAIFIEGKFEHKITNKMRKQSTLKSTSRRISTPREKDTENMKRNQERYGG